MTIEELMKKLHVAEQEILASRMAYFKKKHEFMEVEDRLITAREVVLKLQDQIQVYRNEKDIASTIDDLYDAEIERFSKILPEMLERIKNEPQIPKVDILADR